MKKVLSLLVIFIVCQTQTWALSGGPNYGSTGSSIVGTYSGIIIPKSNTSTSATAASIGIFSLGVPSIGLATGAALVFANGVAFSGTISGAADPDKGTLNALIGAASVFDVVRTIFNSKGDPVTQNYKIEADGSVKAKINAGSRTAGNSSSSAARLSGTAALDIFFNINADGTPDVTSTVNFTVQGFKQSSAEPAKANTGTGSIFFF